MAVTVVDASLIIALLDADDAHHQRATATLADPRLEDIVLPASAYAETLIGPSRRGPAAIKAVDDLLSDLAAEVAPISREVARRAARLRAARPSLRLPDALVLATGDVLEATAVLTTDRRWSRYGRRVRVI
ncbi:MAG TPA: PIN domain-containing protein [Candidatus Limnocylindria bacterium]|nr:PIN domain-containing protein [Candidatus Limnocylindria bacterium]